MNVIALKFLLSISVVLFLSYIAEKGNPKWAGILSGMPTGSAISLFFYAWENGLIFAKQSAVFNMLGLVALQAFIAGFYFAGLLVRRNKIIFAIIGGCIAYFSTIVFLRMVPGNIVYSVIIPLASFFVFKELFKKIPVCSISKNHKSSPKIILMRAFSAAVIISGITGISYIIGPEWAGLLSAFPTTLFPLLLIIHLTYGEEAANSIIKFVPDGLGSLLIYSLIIYLTYPHVNLYTGILLAYICVAFYILLYQRFDFYVKARK